MNYVTPEQAVKSIPDHSLVIFQGGAAEPLAFHRAFNELSRSFDSLTVCNGFSFGRYAFLENGISDKLRYLTWQSSPKLRQYYRERYHEYARFVPIRLGDVHRVISRDGDIKPDVVVIQTSMPQNDGTVSLGISVGPNLDFVRSANLVIAEFNHNMPVTHGESRVKLDEIDLAYESDEELCVYESPQPADSDFEIVDHVMSLVPDGAWAQLGIGSVPDLVMSALASRKNINMLSGLLTTGMQAFVENSAHQPKVIAGELAGTKTFYEFCHDNPTIEMAPTSVTHDVAHVASLPNFVSINSALEIDLMGQSNGEAIGDLQISGVGGSLDYIEAANLSAGGMSIIAMPSVTGDGKRSKIVPRFPAGGVVTTPRYCTEYVVTEYGIAKLRGKDLYQRAEALIAIAHPDFRDQLAGELK